MHFFVKLKPYMISIFKAPAPSYHYKRPWTSPYPDTPTLHITLCLRPLTFRKPGLRLVCLIDWHQIGNLLTPAYCQTPKQKSRRRRTRWYPRYYFLNLLHISCILYVQCTMYMQYARYKIHCTYIYLNFSLYQ